MPSPDSDNTKDNVISFTASRAKKNDSRRPKPPPMFNIPPATKILCALILFLHAAIWLAGQTVFPDIFTYVGAYGGFTPGSWTGSMPWLPIITPLTPITSILLHGSWMHVGMNLLMLLSIGSGVEKWLGVKRYLALFFLSCWIALLTQVAFSPFSMFPVIGASGGISGLFGAVLLGMRSGSSSINGSMMPVVLIWIAISILTGLMGAPDGSSIAWVAHIGGFLGGIGIASLMMKRSNRF